MTPVVTLDQLEVDTSYAVLLKVGLRAWQPGLRPLRGDWDGQTMRVYNPDDPLDRPILRTDAVGLSVLGRWDAKPHPCYGPLYSRMTWQGVAAHAFGQVLRQRELVRRLASVGIERVPEPYVMLDEQSAEQTSAMRRAMHFTFDEVCFLLDRAGV
jgi:hypothetical protein